MKSKFPLFQGAAACVAAFLTILPATAQNVDCAAVAERVATAVKANPAEVLTIVEDAMVAYEQCACEVVSAAIQNSGGTAETVKQIVLVAVQNAETQAPAIAECAVGAAPEHAEAVRLAFAEAFNGKRAPVAATASGAAATTAKPTPAAAAAAERTQVPTSTAGEAPVHEAPVQVWSGKDVVVDTTGSNAPVYGDPSYDNSGKAPVYAPGHAPAPAASGEYFGAAPLTMSNAFLIPPVSASAVIIDDDDDDDDEEVRVIIKERTVTKTNTRTNTVIRTVPRTIIRTVPVSPTSP